MTLQAIILIAMQIAAAVASCLLVSVQAVAQSPNTISCEKFTTLTSTKLPIDTETGRSCIAELPMMDAGQQTAFMEHYLRTRSNYIPSDQMLGLADQLNPDAARMLRVMKAGENISEHKEEKTTYLKNLMEQAEAAQDELSLAYLNYHIAVRTFHLNSDTALMRDYLEESQRLALANSMHGFLPDVLNARAVCEKSDGDYTLAIEIYEQAREAYHAAGRPLASDRVTNNIGLIFSDLGDYEAAIKQFDTALKNFRAHSPNDHIIMATVLINLATAYSRLGKHEEAIRYFDQSRAELASLETMALDGFLNYENAVSLFALGQRDEAIEMLEQSIDETIIYRDPSGVALNWLAARYLEGGNIERTRSALDRARAIMDPDGEGAERLTQNPGNAYWALEYAKTRGRLLSQMGQTEEALPYLNAALTLSEDRFKKEKVSAIVNSELLFELRDREISLELMQQKATVSELELRESRTRSLLSFLTAGIAILVAGFAAVLATTLFRSYRLQRNLSKTKDTFIAEINHRTKNNLQVLSSLLNIDARRPRSAGDHDTGAQLDAANRAQTMALVHDHIYNYGATNSTKVDIKLFLEKLLKLLDKSLGRETVKLKSIIASAELDVDLLTPLGLIVCELVTNTYKHAFGVDGGTIAVSLTRQREALTLTVQDDGNGFDPQIAHEKKGSLGLTLLNDLSAQINGKLNVQTGATGTIWTLSKQ